MSERLLRLGVIGVIVLVIFLIFWIPLYVMKSKKKHVSWAIPVATLLAVGSFTAWQYHTLQNYGSITPDAYVKSSGAIQELANQL